MYTAQDFQSELPKVDVDRSVNVLTVTDPGTGLPYQIIVNRDQLLGSETLQESFTRQIKLAERQTKGFKHTKFLEREKVQGKEAITCIQSEFSQGAKKVFQLQTMVGLTTPKVLILTLSSATPISQGMRKAWSQMMMTLKV